MNNISQTNIIGQRYVIIDNFSTGGSTAKTLLVIDKKTKKKRVLKYSTWNGVYSNGIPWLEAQEKRLKELKKILPKNQRKIFPKIYDTYSGKGLFFYTMDYFKNAVPISKYYFFHPNVNLAYFTKDITRVIDILTKLYSIKQKAAPKNFIIKAHISRVKNKISLLTSRVGLVYKKLIQNKQIEFSKFIFGDLTYIFEKIFRSRTILINHKPYLNAIPIMQIINSKRMIDTLAPSFVPVYFHGDSTLRNFLKYKKNVIKAIDVRGVEKFNKNGALIDSAYELGKMLRSFFLEIVRNNCFTVDLIKTDPQCSFKLIFTRTKSVNNFLKMRDKFPIIINRYIRRNKMLSDEKNIIVRTYFAEACHFLADAVNRMESDPGGKQSLAYYLIGLELFDSFFRIVKISKYGK